MSYYDELLKGSVVSIGERFPKDRTLLIVACAEVDRLRTDLAASESRCAALAAEVESLRADKEIVDAVLKYLGYDIVTDIKEGDRLLIDEKNQKSTAIRVIPGSQAAKDASELRLFRSDFECMEWLEEQHAVTLGRTLGTPESPPFRSHLLRIGLPSRSRSFGGESYRAAIDAARTHAQEGGP